MRILRYIVMAFGALTIISNADAQQDALMSQYMHNQYAINPAFAGSRVGLTAFASYRKQWVGVENSPTSILFSTHTPLKNNSLAVGLMAVNQKILETSTTSVQAAIAYRMDIGYKGNVLAFALQPGFSMIKTDWSALDTYDWDKVDDVFAENETKTSPTIGVGIALYGDQFFVGASVQSLIVSDAFDKDAEFAPGDATYYVTGGYEWEMGEDFTLQPSVMFQKTKSTTDVDITLTPGWQQMLYLELGYRTSGVMLGGLSIRPKQVPQLKVAYTYERTTGDFSGYNSGSHEISISFDFVYRVRNVGPRFF
ncbi:MAG: type IX secretion system membrane protein PorP/SprF [Bacteroidia bacterium]|nr:type IX secretion system membrane protein PorP/SprF [Bacteroidia bacterium]